jgi:hypothetical protein
MERSQLKCKFCGFLCRWVGGVRVYYSHPKWMYYTEDEERAIKTIKRCLGDEVEIVNPRDYDENRILRCERNTKVYPSALS